MHQGPVRSTETWLARAWKRLQQGPENATELRLVRVCVGLVMLVVLTAEIVFTEPNIARFARRLGLPVTVPNQPLGYLGGIDVGLMLATVIGALLGYAIGHGIYRFVWPTLHRQR